MDRPLIASDRVRGTRVFDGRGAVLGSIVALILERRGGCVAYVVLELGGARAPAAHVPLPWHALRYDIGHDGYVLGLGEDQVRDAPRLRADAMQDWTDRAWIEGIEEYFATATS